MKFSKKSRYAIRALVDLTINSRTEHVSLSSISKRNGISLQYLEQIFAILRRAGIVKSVKGFQGGYLLARDSKEISVSDILYALDGSYDIEPEETVEDIRAVRISGAIQKLVIEKLNAQTNEILKGVTLADLAADYEENMNFADNMYYI